VVELGEKYIGSGSPSTPRDWEEVAKDPRPGDLGGPAGRCGPVSVADARRRVRSSWLKRGASPAELGWVDSVLDPDV
jgi:starch phosphorylase